MLNNWVQILCVCFFWLLLNYILIHYFLVALLVVLKTYMTLYMSQCITFLYHRSLIFSLVCTTRWWTGTRGPWIPRRSSSDGGETSTTSITSSPMPGRYSTTLTQMNQPTKKQLNCKIRVENWTTCIVQCFSKQNWALNVRCNMISISFCKAFTKPCAMCFSMLNGMHCHGMAESLHTDTRILIFVFSTGSEQILIPSRRRWRRALSHVGRRHWTLTPLIHMESSEHCCVLYQLPILLSQKV